MEEVLRVHFLQNTDSCELCHKKVFNFVHIAETHHPECDYQNSSDKLWPFVCLLKAQCVTFKAIKGHKME